MAEDYAGLIVAESLRLRRDPVLQNQPGQRVQVDVKFITPIGAVCKMFYEFTAIDDCTCDYTRTRSGRALPKTSARQ